MAIQTDSFLGANTPVGFVSLFDELYDPYRNHNLHIIKGGPGCGKSTLMKRIAARALKEGFDTETVHCSSDPDSLDAVAVPALSLFVCDGTAPHVVEPKFPGACENIINLGAYWDEKTLHDNAALIRKLTLENAICHRRAGRFLAGAGFLRQDSLQLLRDAVTEEKLNGYATRFCMRALPNKKSEAPGRSTRRFLSGVTPKGHVFFTGTLKALATEIILLDDPHSPAAGMLLSRIASRANAHGYDTVVCLDPLDPKGDPLALIVPEAAVALVRRPVGSTLLLPASRTMHMKRFLNEDALRNHRQRLQFNQRMTQELLTQAVMLLRKAKGIHDDLEQCYIAAMDFDRMERETNDLAERVFQEQLSRLTQTER